MRLIDADKAKAELLRIARDIHDCCGFYDGLKAGYQSAADRQILYISPFEETIQYDSPKVGFGSRYPVISVEKFLKWAAKDITDDLPPAEWEEYKRCKNGK